MVWCGAVDEKDAAPLPRVTRDVEPAALADLLAAPPRACVAFVDGDAIDVVPARARCEAGGYRFAVAREGVADLAQREVVLLIDDGPYWFKLRGISVRGTAAHERAEADGLVWYAIAPGRILAWDYGAIREE